MDKEDYDWTWRKAPESCPESIPGKIHPCWGYNPCKKCKAKMEEWKNGTNS